MSGDFIDSNVILYLFDEANPGKRERASDLIGRAVEEGTGWISYQVVQEVLNVITHKAEQPADAGDARRFLDSVLVPLWRVMPVQALYQLGLDIHGRYRYSFYDSLIIAAALMSGCNRLYSEDLQAGQRIEGLTIEDPFAGP